MPGNLLGVDADDFTNALLEGLAVDIYGEYGD